MPACITMTAGLIPSSVISIRTCWIPSSLVLARTIVSVGILTPAGTRQDTDESVSSPEGLSSALPLTDESTLDASDPPPRR